MNEKVNTLAVALDWSDANCATKYKIVVRQGSQDGTPVFKKSSNSSEITTAALTKGKTYYWQVKACNGNLCSKSEWGVFKINKKVKAKAR